MSSTVERRVAAVVGAMVADAAALGAHWLYFGPSVEEVFGAEPEFAVPEAKHFTGPEGERLGYFAHGHKSPGDQTQYGSAALVQLRTLVAAGKLDTGKFAAAFAAEFGPGGPYVGYVDSAQKYLLRAIDDNSADEAWEVRGKPDERQSNALATTLPVVALLAGRPDFAREVERAVRVVQDSDFSVAFYAVTSAILARVILDGTAPRDAVLAEYEKGGHPEEVAKLFKAAVDRAAESDDTVAATAEWGKPCNIDMAFPAVVHALLTAKTGTEAVRKVIFSGGDSPSRASYVGAVFAAAHGLGTDAGIPAAWVERTRAAAEARELAESFRRA